MTENSQNLANLSPEDVVLPAKRYDSPTLEERMSENAYNNILPARYQMKDETGEIVEEQEDVFERVAENIALGDVPHMPGIIEVGPSEFRPEFLDEFPDGETQVEVTEDNVKYLDYESVSEVLAPEARRDLESTKDEFQDLMERLAFIPNTPTLINAGDELQQLSACFVNSPEDDMESIHDTAKEAALTFQSGGGMGYAFSRLRPYGDAVGSTGGIASGPITFMRTYDQMCKTIAQGGTRRGAQMGVMSVDHPDIIQFIHAKNKDVSLALSLGLNDPKDPTNTSFTEALDEARGLIEDGKVPNFLRNAIEQHLSNFNISVGVTHRFMEALEAGEDYTFINPRTDEPHVASQETKELWSRYDLGHHVSVGEPLSVPAEDVWDHIVEGAYENGEPGVIFLDEVNDEHSFDVDEHPEHEIIATNPCGEQPLEEYEACNLAHINLSTVVTEGAPDWREVRPEYLEGTEDEWMDEELERHVREFLDDAIDWEAFDRRIYSGTHFLDNVVTMSDFPIPEIEETVSSLRKVGLGIMGYAQMLVQIGVPYGTPAGNEVARQLMQYINHESKAESHHLADDRGAFDEYEKSKYANPTQYPEWFESHVGLDPSDWEDGFEVRNHNTTTIAPTGTTSMLGNTSGGCEPIYSVANLKNVSQDIQGEDELVQFDDYFLRVLEANGVNVEKTKKEAYELLMSEDGFDGAHQLSTVPDAIADLFVTTSDLSGREHASVQCAFQEGVDSAISKTVNFPSTASREDVREVYEYIHANGGKGVTVYVDGTRSKQVLSTSSNKADTEDTDDEEPESASSDDAQTPRPRPRPDVLDSTVYPVNTGYGELNVFVNEDNAGDPFEVFAEIGKSGGFTHSFTEAVGRLVSLALRSGIPPEEVIDQLDGIRSPKTGWNTGGQQIQSIPDAVAHALKQHDEGGDDSLDSDPGVEAGETALPNGGQQETAGSTTALENGESPECQDCGSMSLNYSEGCKTCEACGWSEC
ncbi:ribonucleotide reductase [Haloarcula californiae tailed virus 1]|uniref:Vitamin B12-dependent ribonucleotide reductase n=1 Tax=Haloarcula californiae tailed virus 1 TaxID=1273746 RepID=R4T814_9CAUD|nr:ribonucleotide reductase [Haloarcula californiae tailed virus 1]AGM11889.1 ribonucleotide reductase [Haloarcula californiae tailed virus 1]